MDNNSEKTSNKKLLLLSMFVSLAGSALMLVSLILPYITGAEGAVKSHSMISYVKLAMDMGSEYTGTDVFGALMLAMVICIGLFSALVLVFSLVKKPIPIIVFTFLAGIVFIILCSDFTSRGVVGENALSWGVAYYMFIIGVIISFMGAVFMLIQKIKNKKMKV